MLHCQHKCVFRGFAESCDGGGALNEGCVTSAPIAAAALPWAALLRDDLALACTRIRHQLPPCALCGKADALICCCMMLDVQWPADA